MSKPGARLDVLCSPKQVPALSGSQSINEPSANKRPKVPSSGAHVCKRIHPPTPLAISDLCHWKLGCEYRWSGWGFLGLV